MRDVELLERDEGEEMEVQLGEAVVAEREGVHGGQQVQRLGERGYLVVAEVQSLQEVPGVQYQLVLDQSSRHLDAPGLRVGRVGGGGGLCGHGVH